MQEAFRQALAQGAGAGLNAETLSAVQEAANRPEPMSAGELEQVRGRARQVGRAWSAMLNAGAGELAPLRASWRELVTALQEAAGPARRTVLQDLERAIGLEDARQGRRMRAYLTRQAEGAVEAMAEPSAIPWLRWPSPGAYFLVTIEELHGASTGERAALHTRLAGENQRRFHDTLVDWVWGRAEQR